MRAADPTRATTPARDAQSAPQARQETRHSWRMQPMQQREAQLQFPCWAGELSAYIFPLRLQHRDRFGSWQKIQRRGDTKGLPGTKRFPARPLPPMRTKAASEVSQRFWTNCPRKPPMPYKTRRVTVNARK